MPQIPIIEEPSRAAISAVENTVVKIQLENIPVALTIN
jgi:hypothetical protein